jgi:hypothetical protein
MDGMAFVSYFIHAAKKCSESLYGLEMYSYISLWPLVRICDALFGSICLPVALLRSHGTACSFLVFALHLDNDGRSPPLFLDQAPDSNALRLLAYLLMPANFDSLVQP